MYQFKEINDFAHSYLICRFDSCMIIDPSHDYESIIEKLNGRTLIGVLVTHAHDDHIDLIGEFNCPIYLHLEDAHLLFEDQHNGYHPKNHPYKKKNLELKYVKNLEQIPLADQYVTVYHTPGHTKGSVCYLFDDKLFTGDTLFKESVGRHDLYSGNLVELRKSIMYLLELSSNIKIYPGHDESSTIRHELKNNQFYLKWAKQLKR
jgi:hydroxyacylglutathione hydrolase